MEPSSRTDTRNGTFGTLRKNYVISTVGLVGLVIISLVGNNDNLATFTLPVESITPASAFEMAVAKSSTISTNTNLSSEILTAPPPSIVRMGAKLHKKDHAKGLDSSIQDHMGGVQIGGLHQELQSM
jgi:hypothetical protein